jgi:ribonuclease D
MLINTNDALSAFCASQRNSRFLTVDTEFMRERTYWPKLCLIQAAGETGIAAIDPLAEGLDLTPFLDLLYDPKILKVFHAARQDIEIFHNMTGKVPAPIADTQVMAMVCGYGDAVSYENIVAKIAKGTIDKSSRFTDWTLRPLSDKQLAYALDDVRFLRPVFEGLEKKLQEKGRLEWIKGEMAILENPGTYRVEPPDAWKRLKTRIDKPRFFTLLRDLAAWREKEAQQIDIPRSRVLRDEALLEIIHHVPQDAAALGRVRGLSPDFAKGRMGQGILQALKAAQERAPDPLPDELQRKTLPSNLGPVADIMKVLLRIVAEENQVAAKLIASSADIDALAEEDDAAIPAMQGWRREIFGDKALALKAGRLALKLEKNKIKFVDVN